MVDYIQFQAFNFDKTFSYYIQISQMKEVELVNLFLATEKKPVFCLGACQKKSSDAWQKQST